MAPTDSEKDDHEVGQYFDGLDDNDFLALVVESEDANESGKRRLEDGADVGPPRKKPHQDDTEPTTPSKPTRREYLQLARRVLQERFGFEKFREEQERAIVNILSGKNTLVIFPSGAGKSLCYQIPAFAFPDIDAMDGSDDRRGGSGISIVVSPLTALMKDQVDALRKRGIKAECIDSTKTRQEQLLITQLMKDGQLRLLYCTPERLNNETFVSRVKDIPGGVRLVAVDEAHCVSEWGHSFRPDYLKVARFTREIGAERVVCLTATATPKVASDICSAFGIDIETSLFRTSPYRPNLQLLAQAVENPDAKYELLFSFLRKHRGATIVYVTLQKQAESLAEDLRAKRFNAVAFHAGLKAEIKSQIQDDFMASKTDIVVATIAFGMGIDKPDIRKIVHFNLPGTIEEYSQQIGRAGRDGKPSFCMFYICRQDSYLRENFARGDLPSRRSLRGLVNDIFKPDVTVLPPNSVFVTNHIAQTNEFDIRKDPLSVIYALIELRYGLIRAVQPQYKEYKFTLTSESKYHSLVKKDKSPEAQAIFEMARLAKKYYSFDINTACETYGLLRADVLRKLNSLHDSGTIDLKGGGVQPRYRILKELASTKEETDNLVDRLYRELELREEDALRNAYQMTALITGSKCFALALAEHFGMDLPDKRTSCGHCTYCLTGKPVYLPPAEPREVDWEKVHDVLAACPVRDDPRCLARFAFGIKSPRITRMGLVKNPHFMCMADYDFKGLVAIFTAECEKVGYKDD